MRDLKKKNYIPSNPCPLLFQRAHGSRHEFIVHVHHHGPEGQRRRKRRRRGGNIGESADDGSDDRGEDRVIVAEGVRNRSRPDWMQCPRVDEGVDDRKTNHRGAGERVWRRRRGKRDSSPPSQDVHREPDDEEGGEAS